MHTCSHSPYYMYIHAARNKDNSWPEEMIALMKEVKAKDKEKSKPLQGRYDCMADLDALGTTQPKPYVYNTMYIMMNLHIAKSLF